jgi:hypothetical protein
MAQEKKPTVRLDPPVNEHLGRLIRDLQADLGLKVSRDDVATALVHRATPAHAAWMLIAYNKHAARMAEAQGKQRSGGSRG